MPELAGMTTDELLAKTERALAGADAVLRIARLRVQERVMPTGASSGAVDAALVDREQTALHALAWMATYVEALRQIRQWALRLRAADELGEAEALVLAAGFGEYLAQLAGGIAMSQTE